MLKQKPVIEKCTMNDFEEIVTDISDFWGSSRTLHLHHAFLIHEFGNTAFIIRLEKQVAAYLFGFFSQTDSVAYIHLVGVREKYQRLGLGKILYDHYIEESKKKDIKKIKAITSPGNIKSINFHQNKIGMSLLGEPNEEGVNIIKDYAGKNNHRVVFIKDISQ